MPEALTSYGPGSSRTTVTGMGGGGAGGGLQGLMEEMMRMKLEKMRLDQAKQARPQAGLGRTTVRVGRGGGGGGGVEGGGGGGGEGGVSGRLRNAQLKAAEAQAGILASQARASGMRAPMRTSIVGGQTVVTPDANAMTGAQRAAHLPAGSSFELSAEQQEAQQERAARAQAAQAAYREREQERAFAAQEAQRQHDREMAAYRRGK